MTTLTRRSAALMGGAALVAAALPPHAAAANPAKNKVVFQVSDADQGKWNLALNNVRNFQTELPDDESDLEVVVYGPGIGMLKGDSPIASRVAEALKNGVKVVACENTMKSMKLAYADMLPNIGYVPAGVVEIIRKQQQGYAYIRP
jgi:intracellular sulfur oxidation DsrE/DsrF family protein